MLSKERHQTATGPVELSGFVVSVLADFYETAIAFKPRDNVVGEVDSGASERIPTSLLGNVLQFGKQCIVQIAVDLRKMTMTDNGPCRIRA